MKKSTTMGPEEEFFLQQLKDMNIRDVQPRFTPRGVEFESLACLKTYYEPGEMIRLLERLADKGYIEKINYGTVGLCPGCSSPVFMLTLACPRCGSLKVSKKELVKHVKCGHSGYNDEFVDGIHYVCPNCGTKDKISKDSEEGEEQFKVSDALYECEDCRSISAKAQTSFNCIKCKTRFNPKDIKFENPCGYRVIEPPIDARKSLLETSGVQDEVEPIEDLYEQNAQEESISTEDIAESSEVEETMPVSEAMELEKPEEIEYLEQEETEEFIKIGEKDDSVGITDSVEDFFVEDPHEKLQEEKPDEPGKTEKRGFLGRIFSRSEESKPTTPVKPITVEKDVVKRSDAIILLIEEDQYRADRIIKSLERTKLQSIEVKHAPSGKLGLRELRQPYDAVILDMSLSDLNPDVIVKEISRWRITTPLIVITEDEASVKILSRLNLEDVRRLEYSEAAVRQLPGIIEGLIK